MVGDVETRERVAGNWPGRCMIGLLVCLLAACAHNGPAAPSAESGGVRATLGSVLSLSPAAGAQGVQTVEVQATGETREQARDEAIRTALQATVSQLVIADRMVRDSQVVRDDIFATQNGFVTAFEVLEESRNAFGEVELRVRVSVSEDTILNYVAFQHGAESTLDGASLFAEVQRGAGQRQVLDDMFQRFVQGYPWQVVSLEMTRIAPLPGHGDRVVATLNTVTEPDFFTAMEQFLERVARASYGINYRFRHGAITPFVQGFVRSDHRADRLMPRDQPWQASSSYPTTQVCIVPTPRQREVRFLGQVTYGVNQEGEVGGRCFVLPPGDFSRFYWEWAGLEAHQFRNMGHGDGLVFLVTFLDGNGQSAIRPGARGRVDRCLLVGMGPGYPEPGVYQRAPENWSPERGLAFRADRQSEFQGRFTRDPSLLVFSNIESHFTAVFRTADVDFERVTAFRGRPLFAVRDGRGDWLLRHDLLHPPVPADQLCQELINQTGS